MFRCVARFAVLPGLALLLALAFAPAASAQVQPYGTNDHGGFRDILPPGTNGLDDVQQLAAFKANGSKPPHSSDQLAMYSNLTTAAGTVTQATLPDYYKNSTFGLRAGDVESTQSPEAGVTILRDKGFGVPHIYGDTRAELMFGIGYATAEDRLFFIDVLRHSGEGQLSQFAGGSNVSMDKEVWAAEPYSHQDLVNQINYLHNRPNGEQLYADAGNYVNGINAYINQAKQPLNTLTMMPAEYAAIGDPSGPQPFTLEDLVSIATLVGGIFGNGGGDQLYNAMLYENMAQKFGGEHFSVAGSPQVVKAKKAKKRVKEPKKKAKKAKKPAPKADHSGYGTFLSFDDPADPEAPTTIHGKRFNYQTLPKPSRAVAKTIAMPDRGTVQMANEVAATGGGGSGSSPSPGLPGLPGLPGAPGLPSLGGLLGTGITGGVPNALSGRRSMSNALLVSAKDSANHHPLAVMGPQVSYFAPEILMEEDIHGPGIDAAGAAFPGVNLYVELGHGPDYAWSATSAGQNIIDTFAVHLCNPQGPATTASDYYVLRGQCVPMETLTDQESWQPTLADSTPAGSITLKTERTAYGIVIARAKIHGQPVAYTNLRSTYMHELDSAAGFQQFNEPAQMRNPQQFFNAANKIGYTFNWFYTDDKHIAYFNSGQNPVRAAHTDPLFPTWSNYGWKGLHPAAQVLPSTLTERDTGQNAHPHVTDQSYLTSWNNKQAPGFNDASTAQEYSSIYRSQLLDNNIGSYLRKDHNKLTLPDLVNAMGVAGTQDLRGVEVLPYALKIIGRPSNPRVATAVRFLRAWVASGAHRINRAAPGTSGNYQQTTAIRDLDAWWPLLVQAEFRPVLGPGLLSQVESDFPINDEPGHGVAAHGEASTEHLGSAFDVGFYGIVQKDLRAVLHVSERGKLNRIYCGNGSLKRCRAALTASLAAAAAESPDQIYPADPPCKAGDQMCSDSIQFRPIGGISQPLIEWINRPTFQQADSILGHGPR